MNSQVVGGIVEGTLIKTLDGFEPIETITYSDILVSWHFDAPELGSAKPLWIKIPQNASQYYLLEFSDGTQLKVVDSQLIFNKEAGKFTDSTNEIDTPIGTTTFTADQVDITLVNRTLIQENVKYYNIISVYFMNYFASNILISCKYNNLYPIVNMTFVKEDRPYIPYSDYNNQIPKNYYINLRLSEQLIPIEENILYVKELEILQVK